MEEEKGEKRKGRGKKANAHCESSVPPALR
jgi:hypothetical protein